MKILEGVHAKMSGDELDTALAGVTAAQIGGGSKKDGGVLSPLEAVGHRYAMDGKIKQVSFVSDKHYSDLDIYEEHLRAKLTTTILDLLDGK